MDKEERDLDEEKRQLEKIKFLGLNPKKFKSKMYDLLDENPELMSGIPRDMRYDPRKRPSERSKWKETFERWRKGKKK